MDNVEENGGFGDESWGGDLLNFEDGACPDAAEAVDACSDGSDFSPAQLAIMERSVSAHAAPLPKGVEDVEWQPPRMSGLKHSSPIFETERDERGTLRISSPGLSSSNCHFRSWQEDNGVAANFASETVEKEVDGQRMTVAVRRGLRGSMVPSSSDTILLQTTAGPQSGPGAAVSEIERLRALRRKSSLDGEELGFDSRALGERDAAGPSPPSIDVSNQEKTPPITRHHPAGAESNLERTNCAQANKSDESRPVEEVAASPSLASTRALNHSMPLLPKRPVDGVATSHARQPRPGRSLSPKGVADGAGASTLPKQRDEAEAARHPSAATVAGGRALEPAGVVREPFVGHISSGIGPSAGAECGGDLARVVGGEDSQRCEAGCAKGKHERSQKPSGPTPSPKAEEKATTRWWGGSRTPRAPSPQPAQQSVLPAVAAAAGSEETPARPRRWLSFRRHR